MAQRHVARRLLRLGVALQSSVPSWNRSVVAACQRQQLQAPVLRPASIHTSVACLSQNIINVQDEADFKTRVVESKTPVVIDFHAGWCGPCKLLGPRLESMIAERDGKLILAKVDIDDLADLAMSHGVQAVPTVLGMKDGKVIDKFVGLKDDAAIESFLDKLAP